MSSSYYTYGTNLRNKEFFTSTVKTDYGIKRYFSNIDADIYFGDKKMEDMVEFQFSVEEQKLPIFSYNKFYADVIVPGQRIVQGTFILNFTDGKYMDTVLSEIPDSVYNETTFDQEKYNPGGNSKNSALFNKNFDIMLCYGDYKEDNPSYNSTVQTICGAQINNTGVALSAKTGEPILEVYSFIAKDFLSSVLDEYNTGTDDTDNGNDTGDTGDGGDTNNTTNNNTSGVSDLDLTITAIYTPQIGSTYGSIEICLWHTNAKNKGILSNFSKTAILDITDENVINIDIGSNNTNFSTKTTLEGKYSRKTDQGVNEAGENIGNFVYERLIYSVSIQPKEYNGIEQNGQATRPIIKKLNKYFSNNPDSSVKGTISYSLTIDSKTSDYKDDVDIAFNEDGTTSISEIMEGLINNQNQNNNSNNDDKKDTTTTKGSLNASSYSIFEDDETKNNGNIKVCFYNKNKKSSSSFNNYSKTAILNITDEKVLNMDETEARTFRSIRARDLKEETQKSDDVDFSTKTTLKGEIRKIGTTEDQRDILMYHAKYDDSRPLMRKMRKYFKKHPKEAVEAFVEFTMAENGKTVEYNENINMNYSNEEVDVEKKIYKNMDTDDNNTSSSGSSGSSSGGSGSSSGSGDKGDGNSGNNNDNNTKIKYKTFGGCKEFKFNKKTGYDVGVVFLNENATGKGSFKNHSNSAQLEITDSRVLNYDLKTIGKTNPTSDYSKIITMNYINEYVGEKPNSDNTIGNALHYSAHLEPESFGNYKLNGYMERPIVQKLRGFFLANPDKTVSATAEFSTASNGKTVKHKENVKIQFLSYKDKNLIDIVEDYMNK